MRCLRRSVREGVIAADADLIFDFDFDFGSEHALSIPSFGRELHVLVASRPWSNTSGAVCASAEGWLQLGRPCLLDKLRVLAAAQRAQQHAAAACSPPLATEHPIAIEIALAHPRPPHSICKAASAWFCAQIITFAAMLGRRGPLAGASQLTAASRSLPRARVAVQAQGASVRSVVPLGVQRAALRPLRVIATHVQRARTQQPPTRLRCCYGWRGGFTGLAAARKPPALKWRACSGLRARCSCDDTHSSSWHHAPHRRRKKTSTHQQVSRRVQATDPPVIVKTKQLMAGREGVLSLAQGVVHWWV